MAWDTWLVYLAAVIALSLAPGPNGLLALTHGARYGHVSALFTISGGALGFVLIIALSMLGIGALLQTSAGAIVILKWLGGAYLVWIGIQLWRTPALAQPAVLLQTEQTAIVLFKTGLLTALSNPKVLLFFTAFLPQFTDLARPLLLQFVVMALTFTAVEFAVEYLLARVACKFQPYLQRYGVWFNRCCGGIFVSLGVSLPLLR